MPVGPPELTTALRDLALYLANMYHVASEGRVAVVDDTNFAAIDETAMNIVYLGGVFSVLPYTRWIYIERGCT
jgi:stage III sporulation protein SpoIIIAA